MIHSHEFEVGGKTLSLESGRVAKQAGGAVLLGMGETVVFASATMSENARDLDFLPLVCDYEERKYAVGKIPGGFIKSGGRPSEKAVLTSRLMDRPLRPLFPKGLRHDVQVIALPFAYDQEAPADVLAICAAGAALAVSDIPFKYPVAGVRVARIDGELVLFPSNAEIKASDLDLVVAGHAGAISMVEAGANELSEEDMIAALKFAHDAVKVIVAEIAKFAAEAAKPKREVKLHVVDEGLKKAITKKYGKEIEKAMLGAKDKAMRESALDDIIKDIVAKLKPEFEDQPDLKKQLHEAADTVVKGVVRDLILKKDIRPDGRGLSEIRPLESIAGILPKVHGSGLFTRGQTQVLTIATLGLPNEAQTMDGMEETGPKRYMHFYNFPPYSVGEVRPLRGRGRREVGHGALAERALLPVIPLDDPNFPYTLLLQSEVLESNGSTSMASVCGSTLALMDAGIQIKAPVAGIAMGLMSDGKVFKVLTDIQGMEDFCGDMDFKVAGTAEGITALQLDTKLDGIPDEVLAKALNQAKDARLLILKSITDAISEPRTTVGDSAPTVQTIQINPEKIGGLIGPGGATIKKLVAETGASIDVQQDGKVLVGGAGGTIVADAIARIKALFEEVPVGTEFKGKVTRIMGRGAMVEYSPGKEGMVPKDQLTTKSFGRIEEVVNIGDDLAVKVHEVDSQGRVNLTALGIAQTLPGLEDNATAVAPPPTPGGDRGGRDRGPRRDDRGGGGGRDRDRGPRRDYGDRPERPQSGSDGPPPDADVNANFRSRR